MGIIKAVNLIFDYIRHDEEEDKDEVSHALKGLSGHQGRRFRSDFRTQRIRKIHIREADERNPASNGWNSLYF